MRRILYWLLRGKSTAAFVTRYFILFGGLGTAAVGMVNQVVGTSPIACSPITGNVVCASSVSIDAQTANYSIPNTDTGYLVTFNCAADCTATLPGSGSPFAVNTALSVANISNATEKPIKVVGNGSSSLCANPCSYTTIASGDLVRVNISYGSSGTVSALTDSPNADTCTAVSGTAGTSGANGVVMFSCPNIAASGAQTFTATISGSPTYAWLDIHEFANAVTSSPDDQGATGASSATTFSLALAGTLSRRGEWVDALCNNTVGNPVVPAQPAYSNNSGGFCSSFIATNGSAQYTMNWTNTNGSLTLFAAAGIKPANPVSVVNLCPGAGTSIVGETSAGCTPLVAGASASIVVNAAGNYVVTIIPPPSGYGPMDDMTASFNMALLQCREPIDLLGFNASSPIIVTVPSGLPSGCTMNMEQGGSAAAQIAAGTNMGPFESAGGTGQNPTGNIHTGGQFTQSNIVIRAAGGAFNFGGTTAP